jgi:hypothetical protein
MVEYLSRPEHLEPFLHAVLRTTGVSKNAYDILNHMIWNTGPYVFERFINFDIADISRDLNLSRKTILDCIHTMVQKRILAGGPVISNSLLSYRVNIFYRIDHDGIEPAPENNLVKMNKFSNGSKSPL